MKLELELSTHEQYIIALSLSAGIVADLWFGILMISPRVLDVPMHFLDDDAVPASYCPVTSTHLFVSAALPLATAYFVRGHVWDDRADGTGELMPDRSDDDGDGRDSAHDLDGSSASGFGPYSLDGGKSAWSTRTFPRSACTVDGRWLPETSRRRDTSADVASTALR